MKTGLRVWHWEDRFKTLEEATEFLLDHIAELGPIAEELARRNKEMEKSILTQEMTIKTQEQTIKTLERSTVNGRSKKRRNKN